MSELGASGTGDSAESAGVEQPKPVASQGVKRPSPKSDKARNLAKFLKKPGVTRTIEERTGISDADYKRFKIGQLQPGTLLNNTVTGGRGLFEAEPDVHQLDRPKNSDEYAKAIIEAEREKAARAYQREQQRLQEQQNAPASVQGGDGSDARSVVSRMSTDLDGVSTVLPDQQTIIDINFDQLTIKKSAATEKLPIHNYKASILKSIKLNRVVIIQGETGCGKTTQVPQFIFDDLIEARDQRLNIICTQPRRIAAISVAKRVCEERNVELGNMIAYQVGMDRTMVNETTRLLYCTTGVLLQKLISEKSIERYSHIIIDEVHERDVDTDLLLMVIRKLSWERPCQTKIILMSATFDTKQLEDYFTLDPMRPDGMPTGPDGVSVRPPTISVEGKPHKLRQFCSDQIPSKTPAFVQLDWKLDEPMITSAQYETAANMIDRLTIIEQQNANANPNGSVLIFLPGLQEIRDMERHLRKHQHAHKLWIIPLHSSIDVNEQRKVFQPPNRGNRKIILATNIAESSITVPDVDYVIDFCLTKNLTVDKRTNYPQLSLEWASMTNCIQRAGRTGRTREGRVFRLIPQKFYEKLAKYPLPEIKRTPLELCILRVKALKMGKPKQLLALCLDPPSEAGIYQAIKRLKHVGALTTCINDVYDPEDGDVTTIGQIMTHLPIDVQLSKLILFGYCFGCITDCAKMAACLSIKSIFSRNVRRNEHDPQQAAAYKEQDLMSYKSKLVWSRCTFSDPLTHLHVYKAYERVIEKSGLSPEQVSDWCRSAGIQPRRIKEVKELLLDIERRLSHVGIQLSDAPNRIFDPVQHELILKIAICGAFYPNYFQKQPIHSETLTKYEHDPFKSVELQKLPNGQGVLYAEKIREQLSECCEEMDFDFENTRAAVTFKGKTEILPEFARRVDELLSEGSDLDYDKQLQDIRDTNIHVGVYLAVKMRKLQIPVEITLYPEEEAKRKIEALQEQRLKKLENTGVIFNKDRFIVPFTPQIMTKLIELPGFNSNWISLYILDIKDCGHFSAIYKSDYIGKIKRDIRQALEELENQTRPLPDDASYAPGFFVRVRDQNRGGLLRGTVISQSADSVKVECIDFGTIETHPRECVSILERSHLDQYPVLKEAGLSFECKLAEIKPNEMRNLRSTWSREAKEFFVDFVRERSNHFNAQVYSVINRVVRLHLYYSDGDDQPKNVNDLLIAKGFAETAQEPPASQLNNKWRRETHVTREPAELLDPSCYHVLRDDLNEKVAKNRFHRNEKKVRLHGPSSVLEVEFNGMTVAAYGCVRIERESVNSVALDTNPAEPNQRLLVAGSLGVTPDSKIIARDTTLMPNHPGLPALMCLLFAKRVDLFADEQKRIYIGALCGLGAGEALTSKGKLYCEYDPNFNIDLAFEVLYSNEDLAQINVIRNNIDKMLQLNKERVELSGKPLFLKQDKNRDMVLKLMSKKRMSIPANMYISKNWNDTSQPRLMAKIVEDSQRFNPFMSLHASIPSVNVDRWIHEANATDVALELMAKGAMTSSSLCLVCNKRLFTLNELRTHLYESDHLKRTKELKTFLPPDSKANT